MNSVDSNTRAVARYNLVQKILEAHNGHEILEALSELGEQYGQTYELREKQGKADSAGRWLHAASEAATIVACAIINLEEREEHF